MSTPRKKLRDLFADAEGSVHGHLSAEDAAAESMARAQAEHREQDIALNGPIGLRFNRRGDLTKDEFALLGMIGTSGAGGSAGATGSFSGQQPKRRSMRRYIK